MPPDRFFLPFGASLTVTGTCHLVTYKGFRLLMDCGAYQGEAEAKNYTPFGFDPAKVDAVIITHAHLDHIGRLPRLVREGFSGRIYTTRPTALLMRPILEDAHKVMKEENKRRRKKGLPQEEPLWDVADMKEVFRRLSLVPYYLPRQFGPFKVSFQNAGHLPGSAFFVVEAEGHRLVFSGDLGNRQKEVLPDPDYPPVADLVVSESTYGDRPHKSFHATLEEFAEVAGRVLGRGGKLIIPSFAMERTQEILFYLREFEAGGRIPVAPVFVDSPLATRVTEVFEKVKEAFSLKVQTLYREGIDPFRPKKLSFTADVEASKQLNELEGPATIIAGSGMLTGGRILHHLRHHLPDPRSAVLFVGYQPRGGLGHRLITGAKNVRIHGHEVPVRAEVHALGGFSGHAGQDELLDWLKHEQNIVLVHGEPPAQTALAKRLKERGKAVALARFAWPYPW